MIRCANCGNSNPDDNNFCDQCGQRLVKVVTEEVDSTEYANNPFKSNESSTTQTNTSQQRPKKKAESREEQKPQPKKTIKKCSSCGGSGNIKEEVHSLFGKTYKLTTCPKCLGAGKYYVDENGKFMGVLKKTLSNSNSAQRRSTSQLTTNQQTIIAVVAVLFILMVYALGKSKGKPEPSSQTATSTTSASELTEAIAEATAESTEETTIYIEYTTHTFNHLSGELPLDWEEKINDYYYSSDLTPKYISFSFYSNASVTDENITKDGYFDNIISWFKDDHSSVDYEYITIAGCYAFKISGISDYDGNIDERYYIDYNGWDYYNGGNFTIYIEYSPDQKDTLQPIIDNLISTCSIDNPMDYYEFSTATCYGMTYEYPANWEPADDTDDSYSYSDPNNPLCSFSVEYMTKYTSVQDEDFKDWFYSAKDEPGCLTYVFSKIDNHNAAKISFEYEDQVSTEYYVGNNDGLIHIVFECPVEESQEFKTMILYIINSCSIDGDEIIPDESNETYTFNKYAYYGSDTYYIIDLDENKVYNFFTFDTDPYVGTCSGNLESGLTVTYNLDGDTVKETITWSGSGDSQICVIDSYGFDWYYNKTSYSSAAAVMD